MSDTTTLPTFEVHLPEELLIKVHRVPGPVFSGHLPEASRTKYERERSAFYRLLPSLLATHFGQYVAIHDEQENRKPNQVNLECLPPSIRRARSDPLRRHGDGPNRSAPMA